MDFFKVLPKHNTSSIERCLVLGMASDADLLIVSPEGALAGSRKVEDWRGAAGQAAFVKSRLHPAQ